MTRVLGALNRSTRNWSEVDAAIEALARIHDQWSAGSLSNKMLAEVLEAFGNDTPLRTALNGALDKVGSVVSDEATLRAVIDEIVAHFPDQAQRYKDGESKLLGFFMGQVMGALKGKANARLVSELLRARLLD
jgi:aspartyl-tRNA(Asn)/glutamyl-tRNA(Gln) amidotransferase subunit B